MDRDQLMAQAAKDKEEFERLSAREQSALMQEAAWLLSPQAAEHEAGHSDE